MDSTLGLDSIFVEFVPILTRDGAVRLHSDVQCTLKTEHGNPSYGFIVLSPCGGVIVQNGQGDLMAESRRRAMYALLKGQDNVGMPPQGRAFTECRSCCSGRKGAVVIRHMGKVIAAVALTIVDLTNRDHDETAHKVVSTLRDEFVGGKIRSCC